MQIDYFLAFRLGSVPFKIWAQTEKYFNTFCCSYNCCLRDRKF